MKQQPIGYYPLAQHCLDNGIRARELTMQHRHFLQFLAARAYSFPHGVEADGRGFSLAFANKGRTMNITFSSLSGSSDIDAYEQDGSPFFTGRASYSSIEICLLWLYPIKVPFYSLVIAWLKALLRKVHNTTGAAKQ